MDILTVGETNNISHQILSDLDGMAILDLTYSDLLCFYWHRLLDSFTQKDLTIDNFNNEGAGLYSIVYEANEVETTGPFISLLYPKSDGDYFFLSQVVSTAEITTSGTCIVSGSFVDFNGKPVTKPQKVVVENLNNPTDSVVGIIIPRSKTYLSDIEGYIQMELRKELTVRISIGTQGITKTVVIPDDESINLFTLLATGSDEYEAY